VDILEGAFYVEFEGTGGTLNRETLMLGYMPTLGLWLDESAVKRKMNTVAVGITKVNLTGRNMPVIKSIRDGAPENAASVPTT